MKGTFKAKLVAIFGAALLALLSVLVLSALMGVRQEHELDNVQGRLVPKAELGPRIDAELERLSRSLQDAVAAQDAAGLEAAAEHKTMLFDLIGRAGPALEPAVAASLRWTIQDYYDTARDVSRRMIAGESGEQLSQDVIRMQTQQAKAVALVKKTTVLDRDELKQAFGSVRATNQSADRLRFGVAALGIVVVALLAFWGGGRMLQGLVNLSSGFTRFGTGDFATPIPITSQDELAGVAREANQMASNLLRLSEERDRDAWLKAGHVGLTEQLQGELEPNVVAERALAFLSERIGALAGAFYVREEDGALTLRAKHTGTLGLDIAQRFEPGQGLLAGALANDELTLVTDVPTGYLKIRSGLGEAAPRELLLLPLVHFGRKVGVLELGLLKPSSQVERDLLLAVRPTLVITLEVARAGATRKLLLAETQAQAERLTAQEEELRLNNQELLAQQEELRRANEELETQRRELAQQNSRLDEAHSVLQDKATELNRVSTYKSQFLANMSHELRTPLNSMLLLSHLLAENETGNLSTKQIEHLRTIHGAGKDLLGLINEVLDLSKIEAGKQDVVLESVEPGHFIAYARRLFDATAIQKRVNLVTELDPVAPLSLTTDRQRVERILTNLLSNALKFTERGSVTLSITRASLPSGSGAAVAFAVRDTGIGIPESARERVFAPFEQVQGQANRGHAGTGLGLAIARESARLLGGDLILESTSSQGSKFVCYVPERAESSLAPAAPSPRPARTVEDDSEQLVPGEPHMLLIEDDAVLAEQLVAIAHARRLKVVVASSGKQGLELARRERVLGIILDVRLPDVDGWSVMERLKRDERTRAIPVHFVSGIDAPARGLALGAVGYLVKPASHAELAGMVRALVPAAPGSKRILLVEDDAEQGAALLTILKRDGFQAEHVQSAGAALEALAGAAFGCMILDLGLPDMDGLGLLQAMRRRTELGAPRVVIHTGRALSRQETRELEAYAEAVVIKDGSSAERLLEEVRLFVHHVTATSPVAKVEAVPRADVSLRGIKLLVAEDDMRTVYSLSALLRSKGADVVTAETGQEALEALDQHLDIRGVLMDVMMPEMDGYEAMRRLRLDERFARLPVIALTAKAMKGERERCIEAGASDYLPKPVDSEKLLSTLRSHLSPGST